MSIEFEVQPCNETRRTFRLRIGCHHGDDILAAFEVFFDFFSGWLVEVIVARNLYTVDIQVSKVITGKCEFRTAKTSTRNDDIPAQENKLICCCCIAISVPYPLRAGCCYFFFESVLICRSLN